MGAPQIIWLILASASLAIAAAEAVEREELTPFIAKLIAQAIAVGLLTWGGFF